jgi:formylglycine-generating enzyme required for sulfatase activity
VNRDGLALRLAVALPFVFASAACLQVLGGSPDVPPLADDAGSSDGAADTTLGADGGYEATMGSDAGTDTGVDSATLVDGPGPGDTTVADAGTDTSTGADAGPMDSGMVATPPSCAVSAVGTDNHCGVGGTTDCCESLLVDGGGPFPTTVYGVAYSATVSSFRFDTFEVTAGRFRAFVGAITSAAGIPGWIPSSGALSPPVGAGRHTQANGGKGLLNTGSGGGYEGGWQSGWPAMPTSAATWTTQLTSCSGTFNTWNAPDDALPISCVNWYQAYAFCIWDQGFLPSVSEFNYAYMGGTNDWMYPWGNGAPNPSLANYQPGFNGTGAYNGIAPVGTFPTGKGLWGQLDIAGNLWEWQLDWADHPSATQHCADCADTNSNGSASRIIRGGDFQDSIVSLAATDTTSDDPGVTLGNYGFRCARLP